MIDMSRFERSGSCLWRDGCESLYLLDSANLPVQLLFLPSDLVSKCFNGRT